MKRLFLAAALAIIPFGVSAGEYISGPMQHFKETAEGMTTEGYEVNDPNEGRFTIVCRSTPGEASLIRWDDGYTVEITSPHPRKILSEPRSWSWTHLQWAEVCQRLLPN